MPHAGTPAPPAPADPSPAAAAGAQRGAAVCPATWATPHTADRSAAGTPSAQGTLLVSGLLAPLRYITHPEAMLHIATSARIPVLEHHVDQTLSAGSPATKLCVTASMDTGAILQTVGADRSAPVTGSALATWPVSGDLICYKHNGVMMLVL